VSAPAPSLEAIRVRLLQIRERPAVIAEEQAAFRERCGLDAHQILPTNVLHEPLTTELLDGVDAVLIGGAGAYSVTQTYPWTASLVALCHACAERGVPTFGSCWGHQFLARAFGGRVIHDPDRAELGTHTIRLTPAGREDALFGDLPPELAVQMGHHDRVAELPPDAVELAVSNTAPVQAFRLAGAPIYGTQFHSELDCARLRHRLVTYRPYYPELADEAVFQRIFDSVLPTPHADGLMRRFLETFCAG
jgi:GMP synthase (glutamine-hydrolysing)